MFGVTGQDRSGKPQAEAWAGEGERHGARARMGGGFFLFFQAEDREETGEARAFSTSDAVCKLQICSFVSSVSHPSSMELSEKCVFFFLLLSFMQSIVWKSVNEKHSLLGNL